MDSSGSEYGNVEDCCKHGDDSWGDIKCGEFLGYWRLSSRACSMELSR